MIAATKLEGQTGLTVGARLRALHVDWIRVTRRTLEPVLASQATFWDRWTAIRYLADPFDQHYCREVALIGSMLPLLPAATAARLTTLTEALESARSQLDLLGRRRGVARAASVVTREFLDLFQLWCAEVEEALDKVRCDALPGRSERLLAAWEEAASLETGDHVAWPCPSQEPTGPTPLCRLR
jgi:hypothetical protein